jgi:hypothetical protein
MASPQRLHKSGNGSTSVPSGAQFVGMVTKILAQKGSRSNWPNENFQHKFTSSAKMYKIGASKNPPGSSVKIYDRLQKVVMKSGSISFRHGKVYGKKNGNVVLTTDKGKYLLVGARPLWDIFNYPAI